MNAAPVNIFPPTNYICKQTTEPFAQSHGRKLTRPHPTNACKLTIRRRCTPTNPQNTLIPPPHYPPPTSPRPTTRRHNTLVHGLRGVLVVGELHEADGGVGLRGPHAARHVPRHLLEGRGERRRPKEIRGYSKTPSIEDQINPRVSKTPPQ